MIRKRIKEGDGDDVKDDDDDEYDSGRSKETKKKGDQRFLLLFYESIIYIQLILINIGDPRFGDDVDEMKDSSCESGVDENENDDGEKVKSKKKGKKADAARKKRRDSNEGFEQRDDGDGEGRRFDYISLSGAERELDATKDGGLFLRIRCRRTN